MLPLALSLKLRRLPEAQLPLWVSNVTGALRNCKGAIHFRLSLDGASKSCVNTQHQPPMLTRLT